MNKAENNSVSIKLWIRKNQDRIVTIFTKENDDIVGLNFQYGIEILNKKTLNQNEILTQIYKRIVLRKLVNLKRISEKKCISEAIQVYISYIADFETESKYKDYLTKREVLEQMRLNIKK